jgi:hypothetical protein
MPRVRCWLYLSTKLLLHEAGTGREWAAQRAFSAAQPPLVALSVDYKAALLLEISVRLVGDPIADIGC